MGYFIFTSVLSKNNDIIIYRKISKEKKNYYDSITYQDRGYMILVYSQMSFDPEEWELIVKHSKQAKINQIFFFITYKLNDIIKKPKIKFPNPFYP